jgi:hypothetical protein
MNKIELKAPRSYSEMTTKQIEFVVKLLLRQDSEDAIWTKCFMKFANIRPIKSIENVFLFRQLDSKHFFQLSPEEVNFFAKKLSFVTQRYRGINPPVVRRMKSCDKLFRDVTFGQYLNVENYHQAYIFTKNEEYLDKIISTLYTGKKKKLSASQKMWTVMWIIGVKDYFNQKYKSLFQTTSSDEDAEPNERVDMYQIIQNQIRALTGGDISKNEIILKSNCWDALQELNEKVKESKELEKQSKL